MAVGALIRLNAVVVAEVQGFAAGGGGLGLVCASDVVIAGEGAKFLAGGTRVGMAPDGGASEILPYLVGFRRATDTILSKARKSVVSGKSVSVRVDIGGRCIIIKKNKA